MKFLERHKYLEQIQKLRKTHRVILLSGLRGSGKSTILVAAAKMLRNEKPPVRIVHLNAERRITSGEEVIAQAKALGVGSSALLIDNADQIIGLPEALAEILIKYAATIILAGKNTPQLETGLHRHLSETVGTLPIYPFSYREFLDFHNLNDSRNSLELYCRTGGLPDTGIITPGTPEARIFLSLMADSFLLTGIVEPYAVRNPALLRQLLKLVARAPGEALPARQIAGAFSAEKTTISPQASLDYLEYCRVSGILIPTPVIDLDRKKILETGFAWYFGDAGLRSAFVVRDSHVYIDRAKENLIFLYFLDAGWNVAQGRIHCGKQIREKISFVCEKNNKKMYVQVIANTATAGERLRKRNALLAVRDAWPKYLLDDEDGIENDDGIWQVYIRDFLRDGLPQ